MRLLLDTHALLWHLQGATERLSTAAKRVLADPGVELIVSHARLWEIAIKSTLGKLALGAPLAELVEVVERSGVAWLPIELEHLLRVAELPLHHRDPFDRLIAAQSLCEGLGVLSADTAFDAYSVARQW